ncbi:hypothetical protein SAMN05443292_0321 [Halpernia frigidisoli]|uniref:Uncharacterized protein n=1 Tax=Halpernia frigidisoli TaxID=1125876 RepID=A0A1I3D8R1_9FLAO|nr:hypothetical protein SAMN05443292_0321 [Halpernia frigidisoli]
MEIDFSKEAFDDLDKIEDYLLYSETIKFWKILTLN